MDRRQLVADVTAAITTAAPATTPLIAVKGRSCNGLNLPVGGILSLPNGDVITLTAAAAFKPVCTPVTPPAIIANGGGGSVNIDGIPGGVMPDEDGMTYSNFTDPFLASTFPQCYALAATTVVAYTLVIMLFITPRSFLDGGVLVLGQRGFTQSGSSGLSIGGRPWLQKVAALTVAISLTIATAATFSAAEEQYSYGIQNAKKLQKDVLEGNELKIIRIISNTFLWLAQAQTLIRLFPRQREKVIIKWTAFALISLDVIFQSLNSFQYTDTTIARPGAFNDAVPALSYLFTLALGVLYAAWVIYYSLMKKRYAYYHPQMKNMCLVATLSLLAILVPVVFFILDLAKSEFTGWGEYVRWVGAAAASVIVWEWVERIEALEREEKRDGILGREVFEGDEMLDIPPLDGRLRRRKKGGDDGSGGEKDIRLKTGPDEKDDRNPGNNHDRNHRWPSAVTAIRARYKPRSRPKNGERETNPSDTQPSNHDRIRFLQPPLWPARPAPAVTPVSRTDTASAASTVYAVRYHPLTETTSYPTPPPLQQNNNSLALSRMDSTSSTRSSSDRSVHEREAPSQQDASPASPASPPPSQAQPQPQSPSQSQSQSRWRALTQTLPLKRTNRAAATDEERAVPSSPPPAPQSPAATGGDTSRPKWDIRDRFEEFAATQAERLREKFRPTPDTGTLPVTVIPAPPRRGAALAQLLEEEEQHQFDSYHRGPPRTTLYVRGDDSSSATLRVSRSGSSGESNSVMPPVTRLGVDSRTTGLPIFRVPAPPRADSTPAAAPAAAEVESRQSGIGQRPSESGGGGGVPPSTSSNEAGGGPS